MCQENLKIKIKNSKKLCLESGCLAFIMKCDLRTEQSLELSLSAMAYIVKFQIHKLISNILCILLYTQYYPNYMLYYNT